MRSKLLTTVVWKEGRHYVSQCLNVDVASFGATRKQALSNLHEALDLYFDREKPPRITRIERPHITALKLRHA